MAGVQKRKRGGRWPDIENTSRAFGRTNVPAASCRGISSARDHSGKETRGGGRWMIRNVKYERLDAGGGGEGSGHG